MAKWRRRGRRRSTTTAATARSSCRSRCSTTRHASRRARSDVSRARVARPARQTPVPLCGPPKRSPPAAARSCGGWSCTTRARASPKCSEPLDRSNGFSLDAST
jgi:hypothetical protein